MNTKEKITDYIIGVLEYLDGRGLIITDQDLILESLESFGDFYLLRNICNSIESDEPNTKQCDNCEDFISEDEYTGNCGLCNDCCRAGFQ